MSGITLEQLNEEVYYIVSSAWQDGVNHLNPKYTMRSDQLTARLMERIKKLIAQERAKAEADIEHYYLGKLAKVYDEINTGVAKKQSNSTYYITKAIHTETEIKHAKHRIAELKAKETQINETN